MTQLCCVGLQLRCGSVLPVSGQTNHTSPLRSYLSATFLNKFTSHIPVRCGTQCSGSLLPVKMLYFLLFASMIINGSAFPGLNISPSGNLTIVGLNPSSSSVQHCNIKEVQISKFRKPSLWAFEVNAWLVSGHLRRSLWHPPNFNQAEMLHYRILS